MTTPKPAAGCDVDQMIQAIADGAPPLSPQQLASLGRILANPEQGQSTSRRQSERRAA